MPRFLYLLATGSVKVGSRLHEAGACLVIKPEEAIAMMNEGVVLWPIRRDFLKNRRLIKEGEKVLTMPGRSLENLRNDSLRIALHAECGVPLAETQMMDRKMLLMEIYRRRQCRTAQQATSKS